MNATVRETSDSLDELRAMGEDAFADYYARTATKPKTCGLCKAHYGDVGYCDEGKPMMSPHRAGIAERVPMELKLAEKAK